MGSERNYTVYFQIYGKKMKTTVLASSIEEAKNKVISKLIIDKVEVAQNDYFNKAMETIDEMLDFIS